MADARRRGRLVLAAGLLAVAAAVVSSVVGVTGAQAQLRSPAASDPRATFVLGNLVTCAGAGFPLSTRMGAPSNTSASDANVSGTVAVNAGTVQPGVGQELNVTILAPDIVIDAIVVKGGPAHNLYTNAGFLPPTLAAPQHYISPFNGGGNVPEISHWFVCYHETDPPPAGTLTVEKGVIPPDGIPVVPIPTSYTAIVNCDDGIPAHQNVVVTFSIGGGRASTEPLLTGIPDGTTCTVVEQNIGTFPADTVVTYDPTGADSPGVTITGGIGVEVGIINDFSGIEVQRATLDLTKAVVTVDGIDPPASFTAHVICDDGTNVDVTLPGTGGPGTPDVTPKALALCHIEELASSIPAGWAVTYSVDGGPPRLIAPIIGPLVGSSTVEITITNDPTNATTTTTAAPTTTTGPDDSTTTSTIPTVDVGGETGTQEGTGAGTTLPFTGLETAALAGGAIVTLFAGIALVAESRKRRTGSMR